MAGKAKRVEQTGPSTLNRTRVLVAGSPTTVVYQDFVTNLFGVPSSTGSTLKARTTNGVITKLKAAPLGSTAYSMSRSTLVGGERRRGHGTKPPRNQTVYWWKPASGTSGTFTPKGDNQYLAAAPNGAIIDTGTDLVRRPLTGGASTSLGRPPVGPVRVVPGSDGFVVTGDGGGLAYQSWNDPGSYVTLDSGNTQFGPPLCSPPIGLYVACAVSGEPTVIPLDGGAPVLAPVLGSGHSALNAALAGNTMIWQQLDYASHTTELTSEQIGSPTIQTGESVSRNAMVAAYGKVAFTPDDEQLSAATTATDTATIVAAKPSPVQVEAFALSAHHVIWTDDNPDPSEPAAGGPKLNPASMIETWVRVASAANANRITRLMRSSNANDRSSETS